jgi:hypothetical protein
MIVSDVSEPEKSDYSGSDTINFAGCQKIHPGGANKGGKKLPK